MRKRILLAELFLVGALGLSMIFLVRTTLARRLEDEFQKRVVVLAQAVAREVVEPTLTEKRLALQLVLNRYKQSSDDLEYAFVVDARGDVVAHTFEGGFPVELLEGPALPAATSHEVVHLATERGVILDIAVPILDGGLGAVRIGVSEESMRHDVDRVIRLAIALILGVLVLGVVVALALTGFAMHPVRSLTAGVKRISSGDAAALESPDATGEFGEFVAAFNNMVIKRQEAEQETQRAMESQETVNQLLRLSLEEVPLDLLLQRALQIIVAAPVSGFNGSGCIFLITGDPALLVRKAAVGFLTDTQSACEVRRLGECECGRVAERNEIEFTTYGGEVCGNVGARHYCVPIVFGGQSLGVLNVYADKEHRRDRAAEESLTTIANALAGVIQRRHVEQEREKLRSQFVHAQKLEAVGLLAGGVASDFAALLASIEQHAEEADCAIVAGEDPRPSLERVRLVVRQAESIVRQLLFFGRKYPIALKRTDLSQVVSDLRPLLEHVATDKVAVEFALGGQVPEVVVDRAGIEQIIMNLVVNARDAMSSGGRITISTELLQLSVEGAAAIPEAWADDFVLLTVADTGPGIPEELRAQVFEPFRSLDDSKHGLGLGLSIVRGLVDQHEAWLAVSAGPEGGIVFRIGFVAFSAAPDCHTAASSAGA